MPKGIPKKKLMSTAVRTAGPSTAEMGMDAVMDEGSPETLRDTMNVSNLLPLATPVVDSSEKPSHHKLGQNPNSSSGSSRNTQQQLLAAAQMPQNAISSSLAAAAAGGASSGQGGGQFASLPQYQLPNYPPAFGSSKYSQLLAIMEEMGKDIRPGYTGNKNSQERLKKGIQAAKSMVQQCLAENNKKMQQ